MMKVFDALPAETEYLSTQTVDAAIKVHRALGPGLLELVYEICLAHELRKRGLAIETQVTSLLSLMGSDLKPVSE